MFKTLTFEQASAELGVSGKTATDWLKGGHFPGASNDGGVWGFSETGVNVEKAKLEALKANDEFDFTEEKGEPPLF